jgi:hypothetical protein
MNSKTKIKKKSLSIKIIGKITKKYNKNLWIIYLIFLFNPKLILKINNKI